MEIFYIIKELSKSQVRCSIVGGYAVALHGVIRGTIDLDLVLDHEEDQFVRCEAVLLSLGFKSRLPVSAKEVFHFRKEYIQNRNLVAWSFYNPSDPLAVIDIVITHDLRQMKSIARKVKNGSVPVISLQDLIAMKEASGRPQDIEDVKSLKALIK